MKHRAILQDSRMVHAGRPPTEGVKFGSQQCNVFSGSVASRAKRNAPIDSSIPRQSCNHMRLMIGPQILDGI